ncbi:MAG TPA: hypothetical protein VJM15_06125 [Sphingomicrobium sp.]|nr:hypothetical protein [Sphingomicrobium sp.]
MRPMRELADDHDQRAAAPLLPEMAPFADIPRGIWIAYLSAWALLFGIFLLVFATDTQSTVAVITACFFALMTLGLPTMLSIQPKSERRPWPAVIATRTGPLTVREAATQIILIPLGAVLGLFAFIVLAM